MTNEKQLHLFLTTSPLQEWKQWIIYQPEWERRKVQMLRAKAVNELSLEEWNFLEQYRVEQRVLPLFARFQTEQEQVDDTMMVYNYARRHSIEQLMERKLTEEERKLVQRELEHLQSLSLEELKTWILTFQENQQPSMIDLCLAHFVRENYCKKMQHGNSSKKILKLN